MIPQISGELEDDKCSATSKATAGQAVNKAPQLDKDQPDKLASLLLTSDSWERQLEP